MSPVVSRALNLMSGIGLGAIWLSKRTESSSDWFSGIGFILVAVVLSMLISYTERLANTKADKVAL